MFLNCFCLPNPSFKLAHIRASSRTRLACFRPCCIPDRSPENRTTDKQFHASQSSLHVHPYAQVVKAPCALPRFPIAASSALLIYGGGLGEGWQVFSIQCSDLILPGVEKRSVPHRFAVER